MSNEGLFSFLDVSRETISKLNTYHSLLKQHAAHYNLVGRSTLDHVVERHFKDSAQLQKYIDPTKSLIDIGAGAGFPGLVLAMLGNTKLTLVDSVTKKVNFLKVVSRETNTEVKIIHDRVENIQGMSFDQITCRAFASLDKILTLTKELRGKHTTYILLKGESVKKEIEDAQRGWSFTTEFHQSITDDRGVILIVKNVVAKSKKNEKNH
jgi:16S rRNA (guanine527-N7)-methyltransferase